MPKDVFRAQSGLILATPAQHVEYLFRDGNVLLRMSVSVDFGRHW